MLESQEKYQYLQEFYKIAFIKPKNIAVQQIDYFGNRVSIFVIEKNESIRIIQADSAIDKPIKWGNVKDMILNENQLEQLLQTKKK